MAVHVGKLLHELYQGTGLKMDTFAEGVSYSAKTIYYHFGKPTLNTAILEKYEGGLKKLGLDVDIFSLISRKRIDEQLDIAALIGQKRSGARVVPYQSTAPLSMTAEPTAADLLRRAAELLDKEHKAPAPDRKAES